MPTPTILVPPALIALAEKTPCSTSVNWVTLPGLGGIGRILGAGQARPQLGETRKEVVSQPKLHPYLATVGEPI